MTRRPAGVSRAILRGVDAVITVGVEAPDALRAFAVSTASRWVVWHGPGAGEALIWRRGGAATSLRLTAAEMSRNVT